MSQVRMEPRDFHTDTEKGMGPFKRWFNPNKNMLTHKKVLSSKILDKFGEMDVRWDTTDKRDFINRNPIHEVTGYVMTNSKDDTKPQDIFRINVTSVSREKNIHFWKKNSNYISTKWKLHNTEKLEDESYYIKDYDRHMHEYFNTLDREDCCSIIQHAEKQIEHLDAIKIRQTQKRVHLQNELNILNVFADLNTNQNQIALESKSSIQQNYSNLSGRYIVRRL